MESECDKSATITRLAWAYPPRKKGRRRAAYLRTRLVTKLRDARERIREMQGHQRARHRGRAEPVLLQLRCRATVSNVARSWARVSRSSADPPPGCDQQ